MVLLETDKRGERGAWISIAAYLFLSIFKLISAYWFNSEALLADGLNNSTDIVLSVAILIGIRISRIPPDENHRYGHLKAESIASLVASFIMMSVGLKIIWDSFQQLLYEPASVVPDGRAAWIALISAGVMYFVYRYNTKLAAVTKSPALLAAAKDNLSDVWVSVGAAIGIFGSGWGLPWLDRLAAVVVAIMICKTAWDIFTESAHQLTDGFDEKLLPRYVETIRAVDGVRAVDNIKARSYGAAVFVDVVIHVHPQLDIVRSHAICNEIEHIMLKIHHVHYVHIHIEPDKKLLAAYFV
ncbi:transporter [Ammoniphilus oxalaticus]|uniref:Transporter n=1 Tax=Ammoniphilus oxalaticus TaxID=66863 RepID=A0A419SRH6_9BACL|nr:cation diffusion facilitator family transporter [Ammoniphilus oxalaticus]RKD27120.1 transporter [Ammoniphilus oxalaticus]